MCYNTAAAAKSTAIQALRSGTLILLFPVLLLFVGILTMAFRSRNRFNDSEVAVTPSAPDLAATRGTSRGEWDELTCGNQPDLDLMPVLVDGRPEGAWEPKRPAR